MACPKCGKQATEYDENKWSCLHCGIKFVFVPPTSPKTNNYVQNTVNVVGQPTYELDVQRAKQAKPIIKTRFENNPLEFSNPPDLTPVLQRKIYGIRFGRWDNLQNAIKLNEKETIRATCWMIFFGCLCLILFCSGHYIWAICTLVPLANCITSYREALQKRETIKQELKSAENSFRIEQSMQIDFEARKNEKITVGYEPVCPLCMTVATNVSEGLNHCLKCGKQFHYSNECSYPIKFKK